MEDFQAEVDEFGTVVDAPDAGTVGWFGRFNDAIDDLIATTERVDALESPSPRFDEFHGYFVEAMHTYGDAFALAREAVYELDEAKANDAVSMVEEASGLLELATAALPDIPAAQISSGASSDASSAIEVLRERIASE